LLGVNPQLATQYAEMATKMEDMAPKFKADTITVQDATGHPTQFAINDAGQQVALGSAPVKLERVGLGSTNVAVDPYTGLPVTGNKIDVSPDTLASNANARQIAQMNIRKDYAINGLNPDGSMPAGLDSVVQGIYEGRIAPPSGQALTRPMGEVLMRRLTQLHPDYDATQYAGREQAVKSFSTGDLGNMIRSNSVATDHLGQLSGLVDQLGNGPIQATNYVKNNVGRWFGSTAATNLDAVKQVVSQEVTKSIVAGGGGQAEREALAEQLSHAATPAQLKGVIEQYQGLMQAQNHGLMQQYQLTTGNKDGASRFAYRSDAPAAAAHPPDIQQLLDKYKVPK
ncbi:MAG: hypothetical protein KGH75_11095, partial [Rhodospirillales bacterium]|nr:hypothetical protein [Rhodospirillales bacterium]